MTIDKLDETQLYTLKIVYIHEKRKKSTSFEIVVTFQIRSQHAVLGTLWLGCNLVSPHKMKVATCPVPGQDFKFLCLFHLCGLFLDNITLLTWILAQCNTPPCVVKSLNSSIHWPNTLCALLILSPLGEFSDLTWLVSFILQTKYTLHVCFSPTFSIWKKRDTDSNV